MTDLVVKVVNTELVTVEEETGVLKVDAESQVDIFWDPEPPSITNTIE